MHQRSIDYLISDSQWWLSLLISWSNDIHSTLSYPILSPSVLFSTPNSVVILQSDASGPDGFGYISGFLDEIDPVFYASQWIPSEAALCDSSSHFAELRALQHFISQCTFTDKLLLWITDSQSACFSVNNGSCHELPSLDLLSTVLATCDSLNIYVLAIWVPRDINILPDYLSHFASSISRLEVSGRFSELHGAPRDCLSQEA